MSASAAPFSASRPSVRPARVSGRAAISPKLIDMPTAMKNRPSSRPLNGAMSLSSACRYSELASRTPARKAPSAIESPASDISSAMPRTSSNANAVNTSRTFAFATSRNTGRVRNRPITITATMAPSACAPSTQGLPVSAASADRSGTSAMSGIAAMSWKSSTANALRPTGALRRLRSAIVCTAIAVDDIAIASPATIAGTQPRPAAARPAASRAPHSASCSDPPPKTDRRMRTSRPMSSSSPIRKSISTTPNSAKCRIDSTSRTNPRPHGPIAQPAIRYPSTEPRPKRAASGTQTTAAAR